MTARHPTADDHSPEGVVRALFAAASDRRWHDVARLGDEESLADFQRNWAGRGADDGEEIVFAGSGGEEAPDAAARAVTREQLRAYDAAIRERWFGVARWADVALLEPWEVVARYLRGNDPVAMMQQVCAHRGWPVPPEETLAAQLRREAHVLGHVAHGNDLAYVVYRERGADDGDYVRDVELATAVRADDGRWRLRLDHELLSRVAMIGMAVAGPGAGDASAGADGSEAAE
jgi:hypothetical protein